MVDQPNQAYPVSSQSTTAMSNSNPNPGLNNHDNNPKGASAEVPKRQHRFGMFMWRIGKAKEVPFCATEINQLLACMGGVDPALVISPHDENAEKAVFVQNQKISNFQEYCDIQTVPWGAPGENKAKAALSMWIASDVVQPDLKQFKHNTAFQDHVTKMKVKVAHHRLHQTVSKPVGFYLGKTPKHTNRKDLELRFHQSWVTCKDNQSALGIPTEVPMVHVKPVKIKSKEGVTDAIALFAGTDDFDKVETFMTKDSLMPRFVPMSMKRANPTDFDNQVKLNNALQSISRAVKVNKVNEAFRVWLSSELTHSHPSDVFDVQLASNPTTLYVQCDEDKKEEVMKKVSELIDEWKKTHMDVSEAITPEVVTRNFSGQDTFTLHDDETEDTRNPKKTNQTQLTKTPFDHILERVNKQNSDNPQPQPRNESYGPIPAMVETNTYAQALMGGKSKPSGNNDNSSAGSTLSTNRTKQLIEQNEALQKKVTTLESDLTEIKTLLKALAQKEPDQHPPADHNPTPADTQPTPGVTTDVAKLVEQQIHAQMKLQSDSLIQHMKELLTQSNNQPSQPQMPGMSRPGFKWVQVPDDNANVGQLKLPTQQWKPPEQSAILRKEPPSPVQEETPSKERPAKRTNQYTTPNAKSEMDQAMRAASPSLFATATNLVGKFSEVLAPPGNHEVDLDQGSTSSTGAPGEQ